MIRRRSLPLTCLMTVSLITTAACFQATAPVVFAAKPSASKQLASLSTDFDTYDLGWRDVLRIPSPVENQQRITTNRWLPFLGQESRKVTAYQKRKDEWERKYCSVEGLRVAFGSNRHWWGDLDAKTARRLYKTLLPTALLELYQAGIHPKDLAPLAYRARLAAKLYARERCHVTARVAANLFDGYRQWRKYGSFQCAGMTYQQVWEKYAEAVLEECDGLTTEDVTAKICLKILERSCESNEMIDRMILRDSCSAELSDVSRELRQDVRRLLQPVRGGSTAEDDQPEATLTARQFKTLRTLVRVKRRLEAFRPKRTE